MSSESLAERIRDILDQFGSEQISPRDDTAQIWDIVYPPVLARDRASRTESIDRCKREILEALLDPVQTSFIAHPDSPETQNVPGSWQRVRPGIWRASGDVPLDHPNTRYWLHD